MPIVRRALLAGLLISLAGCGSATSQQRDRSAVADLAQVLHRYDGAAVHNLSEQASVCQSAWTDARGIKPLDTRGQGISRKQAALLNSARAFAITGFHDCAASATNLNYPLMVQAQTAISTANTEIAKARAKH